MFSYSVLIHASGTGSVTFNGWTNTMASYAAGVRRSGQQVPIWASATRSSHRAA